MEGDRTGVGESDMKRRKRGKQTLKRKMLSILLLCAMSCILAVVIVSYMTIRMIQNDSIQESMQIYLEQITREIDSDYYDMIGIVNQMSPNGTAKFFSPLSVDDFVKKSSIIYYSREALQPIHKDIEQFAKCEQLTAHANSIAVRFEEEE